MKTTNYYNAFIAVAEDCPVTVAEAPPQRGDTKTIAGIQYDLVSAHPYQYTSDDVLFHVHITRRHSGARDLEKERQEFFSRGQPCLRSSPLTKRYGWGIHSDSLGRIALYAVESDEYQELLRDETLTHLEAMRSKRRKG